jgi:hypothetical protein
MQSMQNIHNYQSAKYYRHFTYYIMDDLTHKKFINSVKLCAK